MKAFPGNGFDLVFGSGPLARSVVKALVADGRSVRVATRHGAEALPEGCESVRCDASDPAQTADCARGADVVFQCAQPAYSAKAWRADFPALQRSIMEGARAAGARLVVGDNLYMYGEVDGPIHEDLPYLATSKKGRVRAEMAREIQTTQASGDLPVAVARGSDFFGPGVHASAMADRVFPAVVKGGKASLIGDIDQPHTYTYIEDFGRAMAVLARSDKAYGKAWHVPNAPTLTTRAFIEEAFRIAGTKPSYGTTGRGMLWLGGLFIPIAMETFELMYEFEKPFVVDSSRFTAAFGDLHTPTGKALEATLEAVRRTLAG